MTQSLYLSHMDCVAAFEGLCKTAMHCMRCSEPYGLELLNELDNYKIWAANVGAGNSGNRFRLSLDYRLREATFYKLQVLKLVDTLRKHDADPRKVENANQILSGVRKPFEEDTISASDPDDDSDSDNIVDEGDESPWDLSSDSECGPGTPVTQYTDAGLIGILHSTQPTELGQLLDSIKITIKTLYRMPIRRPAAVDRLKSESAGEFAQYIQHDCMHVQDMFPDLDSTVSNRLGRLITRRRHLLAYRESHQESLRPKEAETNSFAAQSIENQQRETAQSTTSPESKAPSQHDSMESTLRSGATTLRFDEVMLSNISSAYSDIVSISNTSRTASEATQKTTIDVPPRPKDSDGKNKMQFECKYCSLVIRIRSEKVWSKHVLSDLQPYVCTFADCTLGDHMFESRDAWYQHETEVHRTTYFCNVDGHPTFDHISEFRSHMQEAHRLGSELKESAMDIFRHTEGSVAGICNMCFRKQPVKNMKSHLSRHLEQVALFSIPRSDYVENNDDISDASPLNTIPSGISISDSHLSMESAGNLEGKGPAEEAESEYARECSDVPGETAHEHPESIVSPDDIRDEKEVGGTKIVQEMSSHERNFTITSSLEGEEPLSGTGGSAAELVGLLLQVLPIIASAANHQRGVYSAVSTAVRSRVKDEALAIQYQHLHNEVALLHLTIRGFVSDLSTLNANDKERILRLDQQPLKDGRLGLALSQRLDTGSDAFFDTLSTVLKCLDDVLSDRVLGLKKDDNFLQAPLGLYRKLEHLSAFGGDPRDLGGRIRFTSSNSKRRRALATLTEQNKTLERFIRHGTASDEPQRSPVTQQSDWEFSPSLRHTDLIHNTYDAMAKVWNLHCNCLSPHEAMLSLVGCFAWWEDGSSVELDLFISTGNDAYGKWQEGRVRIEPSQRRDPVVVFERSTLPSGSRRTSPPRPKQVTEIESICAIVSEACQNNTALEITYKNNALSHTARKRTTKGMNQCVPLDLLLRHGTQPKLKERRILAVILAHALLYLGESKWLKNGWDKTHVFFFQSGPGQLNIRPYLNVKFQAPTEERDDQRTPLHPSPEILTLGILLLELQLWATIESRRLPEDLTDDGSVNANTNLMTAERVSQETDDEVFENYRAAVRACLDCDFLVDREVDFNDESFRALIYENIVAPLERELYQGWKMKPQDLLSAFM